MEAFIVAPRLYEQDPVSGTYGFTKPAIAKTVPMACHLHSMNHAPAIVNMAVFRVVFDDEHLPTVAADPDSHLWNNDPDQLAQFLYDAGVTVEHFDTEVAAFGDDVGVSDALVQAMAATRPYLVDLYA